MWPTIWFRSVDASILRDVQEASAQQATISDESSKVAPILGSKVEILALDVEIANEEVAERGNVIELFGPLYRYIQVIILQLIFTIVLQCFLYVLQVDFGVCKSTNLLHPVLLIWNHSSHYRAVSCATLHI